MESFVQTDRTTLKRLPVRGNYQREVINQILDESFICHIGFMVNDSPFVIPTGYGRCDDAIYVHGSAASRMMRALKGGIDLCLTVTILDGLVLARSAFHHSMNYRSVVVFGKATLVEDEAEKLTALKVITDHIVPGRWDSVRGPNQQEMKATTVLKLMLTEASAKIRTGGPVDDEEDYQLDVWAGVLPLNLRVGTPVPDERLAEEVELPDNVSHYSRPVLS